MKNGCPINQSDRFSFSVSHPPGSNRHIVKVLLEDMIAENCKMECHVIHIPMRASVCLSSKVSRNLQLHRCLIYPSACLPLVLQESQKKERKKVRIGSRHCTRKPIYRGRASQVHHSCMDPYLLRSPLYQFSP